MWQRRFSAIWAALAGLAILISLPRLYKSIRNGRALAGYAGVWENLSKENYEAIDTQAEVNSGSKAKKNPSTFQGILSSIISFTLWSPPYVGLTVGQSKFFNITSKVFHQVYNDSVLVIFIYIIVVLICITMDAQLITNPNRGGNI